MRPDRTLSGTDLRITVGERAGTETHWETFDGRTADGDAVAVRSLCGTAPEDEYDRFDSLATQWGNISGRETARTLLDWGTDPEPWVAVEYVPGELETLATGGSVEAALDCDLATRADLLADVCEAIRSYGRYGSTPYHLRIGPESVVFREDPNGTDGVEVAPASATVNGAVVDAETGEPLSTDGDGEVDASIELVDGNGESVATATGGSYEFSVDDLDGSYTVTAEADGYESADHTVDSFGDQADIEL
ncbi:hypothetical protein DQW50_03765, partial [Halorubrum sp. 48-1-W]|uniref:carboxypeptidase-like regulatory domain-containing protein n=1 Tax=Halorubrum sp. 48-1-W TaxID=2249761 RepID=UPI000DCC14F9